MWSDSDKVHTLIQHQSQAPATCLTQITLLKCCINRKTHPLTLKSIMWRRWMIVNQTFIFSSIGKVKIMCTAKIFCFWICKKYIYIHCGKMSEWLWTPHKPVWPTFDIRHLNQFIVTECSFPLPGSVHLVLQAAVHHTKLQLQTGDTQLSCINCSDCQSNPPLQFDIPPYWQQRRWTRPQRGTWEWAGWC